MLGGRRLLPNTTDLNERRLLNVVEEMAIASGTPVPPVYVMDQEPGINAFAAGFTVDDAVIGVNRGTIEQLNRDELQGVIAHEFSHVLNGDMRMSLRMIGLLHGIQLIALIGYFILRSLSWGSSSSRRDKEGGGAQVAFLAIGVGLLVVGSIGLFFARLIKASVSRQREYLADASAVQFTRNPDGIAGALKMIGANKWGSRVAAPNAEIASHMYFAHMFGHHMLGWMSTHPPLVDRIKRIDPQFDGDFADYEKIHQRRVDQTEEAKVHAEAMKQGRFPLPSLAGRGTFLPGLAERFPIDPSILIAGVGLPTEEDFVYSQALVTNAPPAISHAVRELFSARCVALAMLLQPASPIRDRQLALIEQREGKPTLDETLKLEPLVRQLAPALRLPMFEVLQGSLAGMSHSQYETYRGTIAALSAADRQTSIFEFFLRHHLIVYLDRRFGATAPSRVRYESIAPIMDDVVKVLSLLVHCGSRDRIAAAAAFDAAMKATIGNAAAPAELCEVLGPETLSDSLERLSQASPAIKKQILSAAAIAITHDRQVTVEEAEIFRAISESLDCPVPPIMVSPPAIQSHSAARTSAI
jgi:Zn-dependent protease with chaperone function